MISLVLVAVDGSEHGGKAIDLAGDLAGRYGAKVVLLHALARAAYADVGEADFIRAAGNELLRRAEDRAKRAGAPHVAAILDTGDPATRIVQQAEAHTADMIVMGRRGLGDLEGLLLGSVSHEVAQLASCACLTVT